MRPFLRTRFCRAVSVITAFTMTMTTVVSTASVAYAAGAVSYGGVAAQQRPTAPQPTVVRELTERAGESKREYLLSNGDVRVQYYGAPVNYRDPVSGDLQPIDTTLRDEVQDGRLLAVNGANSFKVAFPKTLSGDWVDIGQDGVTVSIRPAARSGSGDVAAAPRSGVSSLSHTATEVVYPGAFAGASLSYESRSDGLKETIAIAKPTSDTVYSFDMRTDGLVGHLGADGSVTLARKKSGHVEMTIPRPVMWDSAGGIEQSTDLVHCELSGADGFYRLDVVADESWLADPARVYPVFIDPTIVTTTGSPQWAYVQNTSPNSNYGGAGHAMDVLSSATITLLGYVQPSAALVADLATKKAGGYGVARAVFQATGCLSGSTARVKATMCTTPVDIATVTWNSRPATTSLFETGEQVATFRQPSSWDVTQMASQWQAQDATAGMCTFQFTTGADTEAGYYGGTIPYLPVWTVDYAGVPTVTLTSPVGLSRAATPTVSWTFSDGLTGFGQTRYRVEVATSAMGAAISSVEAASAATSAAAPVPPGGWIDGVHYFVHVRAASAPVTATAPVWSGWSAWAEVEPRPVPDATQVVADTTQTAGWYSGSPPNDSNTAGRGSVQLAWSLVPSATTYEVYASDGATFTRVATTTDTQWSSAGARLFPSDTVIARPSSGATSSIFPLQ